MTFSFTESICDDPFPGIIARALIAICIIFGHFMIFNLFIAINVLQVDEAQRDYHDDLLAEREALLQVIIMWYIIRYI